MRTKTQLTTSWTENVFFCENKGHIARHCKKRINAEKAKAGQHREKGNRTSVKLHVAALKQVAATAPAVQYEATLQDKWPDTERDLGVCMIAEVDEQTH